VGVGGKMGVTSADHSIWQWWEVPPYIMVMCVIDSPGDEERVGDDEPV
jgi:hypothetical protein